MAHFRSETSSLCSHHHNREAGNYDIKGMERGRSVPQKTSPCDFYRLRTCPDPNHLEPQKVHFQAIFYRQGNISLFKPLKMVLGQQRSSDINKNTPSAITFMVKTIPVAIITELWKENKSIFNLLTSTQRHWKPWVIRKSIEYAKFSHGQKESDVFI